MRLLGGLIVLVLCLTLSSIGMAAEVGDILKARDGRFKLEVMGDTSSRSMELDGSVELFSITSTREDANADADDWKRDGNDWAVSNNFVIGYFGLDELDIHSRRLDKLDETITMESLLFKFTFAPTNGLAVYLKAGQSRIKTDWGHAETTWELVERDYDTDGGFIFSTDRDIMTDVDDFNGGRGGYGMAYGVGVRYYFIEQDSFNAGLDVQYNHLQSDDVLESKETNIDYNYNAEGTETFRSEQQRKFKVDDAIADEFQIALLARKTIGDLSAYGGLKYTILTINYEGSYEVSLNRADYDEDISESYSVKKDFNYDSKPDGLPLGLFFGADYKLTESIGTKFEVRLLDEFGVSGGLYYTF